MERDNTTSNMEPCSSSTDSSEESPLHQTHLSLKRRKKLPNSSADDSDDSPSSRPSSPDQTQPHWNNSNSPPPPLPLPRHHHLNHHHHHYHHLYHLQHQLNHQPEPETNPNTSPFINLPRSNSEHSSSTTCLDSLDSHINFSSLSPSTTSNNSPQHHLEPSHDLVPLLQSEYFHSHHLRTSHHKPPKLDPLLIKYPLSSSPTPSSRRSLANQIKRWVRSSISSPGLSIRWLKKSLRPRLPLGILLGLLLFISFAVSLTVFLIHYLDTDKEPLPWRTYCQEQREFPHELADSLEPVNVFVGVFSIDSAYERRHLIRSTYARHSRPIDPLTGQISHNVQLKFVLGKPRIQHVRRIALEMETYNDIVVLDIQENMNRGKSYAFLSWASENATVPVYYHPLHEPKPKTGVNGIGGVMYPDHMQTINVGVGFKKADFVVKADDDAFIVLSELERHLRVAPRTMTYWGYLIRNLFMGGECYALSADLVSYVANSERVLDHLTGAEDKKVAKWMRIHPNATDINWVTERCWIYDHPKAGTTYSHGFLFPDQVKRIRDEGKFGLSESEIELRGPGRTQSYSSVIKWKERYVAPKSLMTIEEEVEALVEGGGRFSKTDWKRPVEKENLIPVQKALFDSDDPRLLKSSIIAGSASLKSSAPLPGEFTPPIRDHYQEPSLKFGRPPNELMAKMPPMEDLPESLLKDKLREGLAGEMAGESQSSNLSHDPDGKVFSMSKKGKNYHADDDESKKKKQHPFQFVPSPTLRFDPEEMRIRNERFLNLSYGGTVVVHYLKRNEWFLETSLILLGRAKTWDDGLIPVVYEPSHHVRSASRNDNQNNQPTRSTIQPDGDSVVVSSSPVSSDDRSSKAISTVDRSSSSPNNRDYAHQKKIRVSDVTDWGKFDQVEEIRVGGMFGGARMFGSPVIENDGTISEGRRQSTIKPRPGSSSTLISGGRGLHNGFESKNGNEIQDTTGAGLGNDGSVSGAGAPNNPSDKVREHVEEDDGDQKADDIRRTQFGGAGWIRGKPRLRVADQMDGPRFDQAQSYLSPSNPTVEQHYLHQDEHQPLDNNSSAKSGSDATAPSSETKKTNAENEDDDQEQFTFGTDSDSSLVLDKHQSESLVNPSENLSPDAVPDNSALDHHDQDSSNATIHDHAASSHQLLIG